MCRSGPPDIEDSSFLLVEGKNIVANAPLWPAFPDFWCVKLLRNNTRSFKGAAGIVQLRFPSGTTLGEIQTAGSFYELQTRLCLNFFPGIVSSPCEKGVVWRVIGVSDNAGSVFRCSESVAYRELLQD
ncbi:hypothetical protein OV450_8469 [Actinobacteria bacterium OV450]|nr:hypothetical protein OV450_8469 [Actinobacteria bacterium OV450]